MSPSAAIPDKAQVPIVVAVIKNDAGQLLIARRNDPSLSDAHDKWELVGGRLEWAESPEQAIIREVKEEAGLDVEVVRLLPKIYPNFWKKSDGSEYKVLLIAYECKVIGGQLHASEFDPKIAELKFIPRADVDKYEFLPLDPEIINLAYAGH